MLAVVRLMVRVWSRSLARSCPPPPHAMMPRTGHYVSLIKAHNSWLFFDDEAVDGITESQIQSTFGSTQEYGSSNMDHGYLLFFDKDGEGTQP